MPPSASSPKAVLRRWSLLSGVASVGTASYGTLAPDGAPVRSRPLVFTPVRFALGEQRGKKSMAHHVLEKHAFRPHRHGVYATVGFVNASAREACIVKIREVETSRYDAGAIDACMATVRQHAPHGSHGDALCATIEQLLRAGNASRAERLLEEASVASWRFPFVWVTAMSLATVALVGVLYGAIKSKADEAVASAPQLVVGTKPVNGPEAALTDATVSLLADLAAGHSEEAYRRMSETYRALVSLDRFEAAVAANQLLRGAHDAVPSHWSLQLGTAEVRGSVLTSSGQKTAFTAAFAHEASGWRATAFSIGNVPALPQGPR
jgi:hypothetical protein